MVVALSAHTGVPLPDLTRAFGRYLFGRFSTLYPAFFEGVGNAFDMLKRIDDHIHVEVRKLYPDPELPRMAMEQFADDDAGRQCRRFSWRQLKRSRKLPGLLHWMQPLLATPWTRWMNTFVAPASAIDEAIWRDLAGALSGSSICQRGRSRVCR